MNTLLAVLIVLGVQQGAHSSAVVSAVTHPPLLAAMLPSPGPPPVQDASPAQDAADEPPTAQELLDAAARFQRGDTPREPPEGIHGLFTVHVKDLEKDSSIDARVERTYLRDPVRMLTTRQDTLVNSDSTVGFDGERAWFRDNATGKVIVYSEDPFTYEVDLELVRDQLRLMPVLLDAFVLDALIPRLEGVRLDGGVVEIPTDRRGRRTAEVQWVVGRMEDELFEPEPGPPPMPGEPLPPPPEVQVGLAIEPGSGTLWAIRVRTLGRSVPRQLELRFFFHLETESGLKVPAFTAVYQDGEVEPFITLGMNEDPVEGGLILDLDPQVDDGIFAVPD